MDLLLDLSGVLYWHILTWLIYPARTVLGWPGVTSCVGQLRLSESVVLPIPSVSRALGRPRAVGAIRSSLHLLGLGEWMARLAMLFVLLTSLVSWIFL